MATTAPQSTARVLIQLEKVVDAAPWQAFLLPVSKFPVPVEEYEQLGAFMNALIARTSASRKLNMEVFLQLEQLGDSEARALLARQSHDWVPEVGLGVWPDRPAPSAWTQEEFMSAAAENKRPRPLMYQVFQITGAAQARQEVHQKMGRFGALVEFFTTMETDALFEHTSDALLPGIEDPTYSSYPFFVPLIERKTLAMATPKTLDSWIGDAIYLRFSFEDKGILIISPTPLEEAIAGCGGRVLNE